MDICYLQTQNDAEAQRGRGVRRGAWREGGLVPEVLMKAESAGFLGAVFEGHLAEGGCGPGFHCFGR